MTRSVLFAALLACTPALAGVPEPDVVFCGHVRISPTNAAYGPAGVTWSLSGNAETLAVSQTTGGVGERRDVFPHPHPFRDASTGRPNSAPRDPKHPFAPCCGDPLHPQRHRRWPLRTNSPTSVVPHWQTRTPPFFPPPTHRRRPYNVLWKNVSALGVTTERFRRAVREGACQARLTPPPA